MKFISSHSCVLPTAVVAMTLIAATSLHATLIAYEGFNYSPGLANDALINTAPNGGSGFTTGFTSANVNYLDTGLSHPGLISIGIGGAMKFDPSDTLTERAWGSPTSAPADGTYWYSFAFKPDSGGRGTFNIMSSTLSSNGQNGVGLRLDNETNNSSGTSLRLKALSPSAGESSPFTVNGGYGATYFIVGRITLDSTLGSSNRIWINPTSNVAPLDTDSNSVSVSFNVADTATVRPSLGGRMFGGGGTLMEDEIRIGTTAGDVMAIPEPSASMLGLLGSAFLIRRRRR
jgi:hypothetical protein